MVMEGKERREENKTDRHSSKQQVEMHRKNEVAKRRGIYTHRQISKQVRYNNEGKERRVKKTKLIANDQQ